MGLFTIDKDTCNKDGLCAAVCPAQIIRQDKDQFPEPVEDAEEICIQCGHCVAVCPKGSLSHKDMPLAHCPEIRDDLKISPEQTIQFLRNRRSIRVYKDKPVPRDLLSTLIDTARYAPTGHNSQCVEWMVIDDPNLLKELSGTAVEWMRWMTQHMADFAAIMHMDRTICRFEDTGEDVILRGAPALIVTHGHKENNFAPASCTIALAYLELAATGLGLGTCFAGYLKAAENFFPPMKSVLSLPENHECMGALMVGYPKFKYTRLPARKEPVITWR